MMPGTLYEHGRFPSSIGKCAAYKGGSDAARPPKAKCSSFQIKMQTAWMPE